MDGAATAGLISGRAASERKALRPAPGCRKEVPPPSLREPPTPLLRMQGRLAGRINSSPHEKPQGGGGVTEGASFQNHCCSSFFCLRPNFIESIRIVQTPILHHEAQRIRIRDVRRADPDPKSINQRTCQPRYSQSPSRDQSPHSTQSSPPATLHAASPPPDAYASSSQ